MRKFVLIAATILASTAAHAGDLRSLSTNSTLTTVSDKPVSAPEPRAADSLRASYNEAPATTTSRNDTPRYAPPPAATTAQTEPAPAAPDAPRYNARPAPVETTPPAPATTATTPTTTTTPSAARQDTSGTEPYRPRSRPRYASNEPYSRSYAPRHGSYGYGWPRAHRYGHWAAYRYRVVAQLHRYGIYW
jgi:hypothetical protein